MISAGIRRAVCLGCRIARRLAWRSLPFAGALLWLTAASVQAHPLAPALLHVEELGSGRYAVSWKVSSTSYDPSRLVPQMPLHCRELGPATVSAGVAAQLSHWVVDCGEPGLAGYRIQILGLDDSSVDALVTVEPASGGLLHAVLRAGASSYIVPPRPRLAHIFLSYGALGIEHILTGYDHLLFVAALMLLVRAQRRLVVAITGFTLGHSLTLSLATLGWVQVAAAPVEALIAASVAMLAAEIVARGRRSSLVTRAPWLVTTFFGLLHGLGFAGALAEIGLPHAATAPALAAFNLGVEVGQLGIVCACMLLAALARPMPALQPLRDGRILAYPIGVMGAFWTIERTLVALSGA